MSEEVKCENCERLQAQLAEVMGDGGSYRKLQVELDAALQKHADDAEKHRQAIDVTNAEHKAAMEKALTEAHADSAKAIAELRAKFAEEIAALKASVLVPALRDMHARQAADLAAKHQAELDRLK